MKFAIPPRLAVDADGYVWRIFDDEFSGELWSAATVNLDNEPTPEPVTFYVPADQVIAARRDGYACGRFDEENGYEWAEELPS